MRKVEHALTQARAILCGGGTHMAMSMLRRSTVVSITYKNEITHAEIGELVESRAQSKKSFL